MFDHLTDEKRARIHVNNCVRREELDKATSLAVAAEPGQWLVDAVGESFRVVRYTAPGGGPRPAISTRASFDLAAASESLVPRLLRGIDALEQGVANAQAEAASFRRSYAEEQDAHRATIERQAKGATGPEHELELLARYATLSAAGDVGLTGTMPEAHDTRQLGSYVRHLLARWAGGASIAGDLSVDVMARVQREVDERARHRADEAAEIADLRAKLKDALGKVARGEVPEVLQPALKKMRGEARKAARRAT